jgi:hypothetical protein
MSATTVVTLKLPRPLVFDQPNRRTGVKSALGHKWTSDQVTVLSALPSKADIS